MQHILFGSDASKVNTAILIKKSAMNRVKINQYYIEPHKNLQPENFIVFDLDYNDKNKATAKIKKACVAELLPALDDCGVDVLQVCDAEYFKTFTGNKKTDPFYGYVCPCSHEGYEHIKVVLCPNYQAMMYNPNLQEKVDTAITTIDTHFFGSYEEPGKDIIKYAYYPTSVANIKKTLNALHKFPLLSCDIEARSLEFWNAGVATISFAWDKHKGVAFAVDRCGDSKKANTIKKLLKKFLIDYKGSIVYHNVQFDCKVLIYELWMKEL